MAGIGFELKSLFEKEGILPKFRAYGYASLVSTGPMILGVTLLLGIMYLATLNGATRIERELLVSMITYALLASLVTSGVLSTIITRYLADMLYSGRKEAIMPSFYGVNMVNLFFGGIFYGAFLWNSGVARSYQLISFLFFLTLVVVWTEMTYLTALKDYKQVMLTFLWAVLAVMVLGYFLVRYSSMDTTTSLLLSVWTGYGIMCLRYFSLLYQYFPEGSGTSLNFLRWIEKYPSLFFLSTFINLGLFGHLVIMWNSPLEILVQGAFHGAPTYDVAALVAIFSILLTTVNFVSAVEVRFYPIYKDYFSLFNYGGNIQDIDNTEKNMLRVLSSELSHLAFKQVIVTILFISVGTIVLPRTSLGFNSDMLGIYRMLCIGYALYAIGNSLMMIMLYFEDNVGASVSAFLFAFLTNGFTLLFREWDSIYYGLGFIIGSAVFCIVCYIRMDWFINHLRYQVLSKKPIFVIEKGGIFTYLCNWLERKSKKKQRQFRKKTLQ